MQGYSNSANSPISEMKETEAQAMRKEVAQKIMNDFDFNGQIQFVQSLRLALLDQRVRTLNVWSEERDMQAKRMDEIATGNDYLK